VIWLLDVLVRDVPRLLKNAVENPDQLTNLIVKPLVMPELSPCHYRNDNMAFLQKLLTLEVM
jgi:hypothetical protein